MSSDANTLGSAARCARSDIFTTQNKSTVQSQIILIQQLAEELNKPLIRKMER